MKKKVKNYVYLGLGFPVVLGTVEMREHGKDQYPVINNRKLQDAVFDFLIDHPVRLTGAQIAFIRKYMELTQGAFAKTLDLAGHARVSQWEKAKDEIADIRPVYLAALRAIMANYRGRLSLNARFFAEMVEGQFDDPEPIRLKAA